MRGWLLLVLSCLTACGASPPPDPPRRTPVAAIVPAPEPIAPVTEADLLPAPRPEPEPVPLPVDETARPTRVQHLATLRPAMARCGQRHEGLTPGFAGCACEVLCRARFPTEEGTTTIRFPFVEVDGLVFTIEPAGRVSSCAYSISGRVLADITCSEDD